MLTVFLAAAEMVGLGARPSDIARETFQSRSMASLRLEAAALERVELLGADGSIALSWLSLDDFARCGATRADAEPIVSALRGIRGVRVACLLREQEGCVKGSLRAKDDTDVARIARLFGGGGHVAAAGLTIVDSLPKAVEAMRGTLVREAGATR